MSKTAAEIRREFIEFFQQRGHEFVPSAPVVPHDDPTLLFTNAGMNQFKPLFLGQATATSAFGRLKRAANSQKCIRAGGKHNDLDDVGHDTYHHTFFEMLGNWSFGDYFKVEAITWAWELLTKVWGMAPERLHATYFGGDADEGLAPDEEARDLWRALLPAERIHPGNKKDNFWEMGDTGPCGPCSEIHIDLTPDLSGGGLVNAGDARVIEIWNLVFIQFNRGPDGKLTPLPAKHVDTGMGFERVAAVLQGRKSNYETDVFAPIFSAIREVTGAPAYTGALPTDPGVDPARALVDVSYRVIADHIRTLTFAISDGAVPDKEGRGYVLRRILRRAVRYGWQYLHVHEPFLYKLVPAVTHVMADAFPELRARPGEVIAVIHEEEASFGRTLERGIALFEEAAANAEQRHAAVVQGVDAFKLHDTYGFPIDLTEIMAAERGLRVDIGEYERLMEEARAKARAGGRDDTREFVHLPQEILSRIRPTDDAAKYTHTRLAAQVTGIIRMTPEGVPVLLGAGESLRPGDRAAVVTDHTCFYAEAGGQVGDLGEIVAPGLRFEVEDTQRPGHYVQHVGTLVQGALVPGAAVELVVDPKRAAIMRNHSGTHLLNWALREVLGEHVQQKGSLVDPDKTRFDFSHPRPLTPEELDRIEQLTNEQIARDLPVYAAEVPQEEALRIRGLRAVFGERYPDRVRVLSIGAPVEELLADPESAAWRAYSIEFCGGTHVARTAEIEHFVLTTEEGIAKGIRRIVGLTGAPARIAAEIGQALEQRAVALLAGPPSEIPAGLAELQNTLQTATLTASSRVRLRAQVAALQQVVKHEQKSAVADAAGVVLARVAEVVSEAERISDTAIVVAEFPDVPLEALKTGADAIKQRCGSVAILLGVRVAATEEQPAKALLLAAVTPDLVPQGLKAGDLVKAVSGHVGGGGGGSPTMAQAGGKNPDGVPAALSVGAAWLREKLRAGRPQ
ncbi:MAG: alanine--tRNA ligase [Phycisphaerales bacterium]|nr:alanine--tRNA ligase [Phycisphaerales bacterium]